VARHQVLAVEAAPVSEALGEVLGHRRGRAAPPERVAHRQADHASEHAFADVDGSKRIRTCPAAAGPRHLNLPSRTVILYEERELPL
jgi:hypothetical protein